MTNYKNLVISKHKNEIMKIKTNSDDKEGLWIWKYELDDGTVHNLYIEIGEIIKFKVIREEFNEIMPNENQNNENQHSEKILYAIHVII